MLEIIERIVDDSVFEQFKEIMARRSCAAMPASKMGRGIVANQRKIVKNKKGKCRWAA